MSTQLTIVICAFFIGAVILGCKWIEAVYNRKEVADASTLCREAKIVSGLMEKCLAQLNLVTCDTKVINRSTSLNEAHLCKLLDLQKNIAERLKSTERSAGATTENTTKCVKMLKEMHTYNQQMLSPIEGRLDGILQNVVMNVGIKTLNEAIGHTNSLIEDNCKILKDQVGNIYSETASIDSRLNGYFGEQFKEKASKNEDNSTTEK